MRVLIGQKLVDQYAHYNRQNPFAGTRWASIQDCSTSILRRFVLHSAMALLAKHMLYTEDHTPKMTAERVIDVVSAQE